MSKLFISYRRSDTGYQPEIIKRTLSKYIDDEIIFYDHDIEKGDDFVKVINDRLESAQVMLVLIGKDWLNILKERSKLASATDFVKLEIERGLEKDKLDIKFSIIPVLFEGAKMPNPDELPDSLKSLSWINALEIDHNEFIPKLNQLGKDLCHRLNNKASCFIKRFKWYLMASIIIAVGGFFVAKMLIAEPECDPFTAASDLNIMLTALNNDQKNNISNKIISGLNPFAVSIKYMEGRAEKSDSDQLKSLAYGCGAGIFVNCGAKSFQFDVLDTMLKSYIIKQYLTEPSRIDAAYADIDKMTCLIKSILLERNHQFTDAFNEICLNAGISIQDSIHKSDTLDMILAQSTANVLEKQGKLEEAIKILEKLSTSGGINPDTVYTRMSRLASKTKNTSAEIIAKTGLSKQAEIKGDKITKQRLESDIKVLNNKLNIDQGKVEAMPKPIATNTKPTATTPTNSQKKALTETTTVKKQSIINSGSASSNVAVSPEIKTSNVKLYENLNRMINKGNFQEIDWVYNKHKEAIDKDSAMLSLYYESRLKAKKIADTMIPAKIVDFNTRLKTAIITNKIINQ
jgi:hypothetical protein